MLVRLTKGREDRPGTLTCVRDDGTQTWQKSSPFFALHDLIHYAVETTLGYREAFLGLVASGRDIDAFGTRKGIKDTYTREEGWAELIVSLLQFPAATGPALHDAEFFTMLEASCADRGLPAPPITPEQLARVRAELRRLHDRWHALPAGETLELTF